MPHRIALKRAYEPPLPSDGTRVLVERLWPRGLTRARAKIDLWLKDIAPSPELRKWYGHDVAKWSEFKKRYQSELRQKTETVQALRKLAADGPVTLVYAARDEEHNSALLVKQEMVKADRGLQKPKRLASAGVDSRGPREKGD